MHGCRVSLTGMDLATHEDSKIDVGGREDSSQRLNGVGPDVPMIFVMRSVCPGNRGCGSTSEEAADVVRPGQFVSRAATIGCRRLANQSPMK